MPTPIVDAPSPGGWFRTYKQRIAAILTIGVVGVSGYGALNIFGTSNAGQAIHYCQGPLLQSTAKGGAGSCLNRLTETAAVISVDIFVATNPSGRTRLDAGTASGATYSGANMLNNVDISGAPRLLSWALTGGTLVGTYGNSNLPGIILAPSSYVDDAMRYLNLSFGIGSGQVVGGYAGWYRIGYVGCSIGGLVEC